MNKKNKILVADDDPAIVDAMEMILEMEGYDVNSTVDGGTIYTIDKAFLPDLVLLDIWMSGHDGRDICRYLKANTSTQHIPVIMISASRDIVQSAKEAGADAFLAKPFEVDNLLETVKKHLNL